METEKALERIPGRIREWLPAIDFYCRRLGYRAYLVGGAVRDILLGREITDLDVTIVGDAVRLADAIAGSNGCTVRSYPEFKTASVVFHDGCSMDFATARQETYPYPASLPRVRPSSLYHDLYRRDFTVNAMAIALRQGKGDRLIDYFGGLKDLKAGVLRALHPYSFVDDPTRIFRCIRLALRYGFAADQHTMDMMVQSIRDKYPLLLSVDRIAREFDRMLSEKQLHRIIAKMMDLGLWDLLFPGADIKTLTYERLAKAADDERRRPLYAALVLMEDTGSESLHRVLCRYARYYRQLNILREREKETGIRVRSEMLEDSCLYSFFPGIHEEILHYTALMEESAYYRHNTVRYLDAVSRFPFFVDGNDLKALGVPPGPVYKNLLRDVKAEIIKENKTDREGQLDILRRMIGKGEDI